MFILGILLVYIIGADDVAKSVPVTTVRIISPVIVMFGMFLKFPD